MEPCEPINEGQIGILAIQESHLNNKRKNELELLFGKRMKIVFSTDADNPMGKGGVATVFNCDLINV